MARLSDEGTGWMVVRLSDVPVDLRQKVARRVIQVEGLVGFAALELLLAATEPLADPSVTVRSEVARKVLEL